MENSTTINSQKELSPFSKTKTATESRIKKSGKNKMEIKRYEKDGLTFMSSIQKTSEHDEVRVGEIADCYPEADCEVPTVYEDGLRGIENE